MSKGLYTSLLACLVVLLVSVSAQEEPSAIAPPFECPTDDFDCHRYHPEEQYQPPPVQDVDAKYTRLSKNAYVCPSGYHYISYNDLSTNIDKICPLLSEWSINRIEGGGSVDGNGYDCRHRLNDPRGLEQAICVKTKITNVRIESGSECSYGYDVISYREAAANYKQICSRLNGQAAVHVGYQGSIQAGDSGCKVTAWDDQTLNQVVCVKRTILYTKLYDSLDSLCGQDRSFLTVEEVADDLQTYCDLIPSDAQDQAVRLAGGASLTNQDGSCRIADENTRPLQYGLCGNGGRPNIDGDH